MLLAQGSASSVVSPDTLLAPFTAASTWALDLGGGLVALTAVAALFGFLLRKYSS